MLWRSDIPGDPAASDLGRWLGGPEGLLERLPIVTFVAELTEGRARLRYISPQIEELSGFAPGEWLGDSPLFVDRLHPADRDEVLKGIAERFEPGTPPPAEFRWIHRDGRTVWVGMRRVALDSSSGRVALGTVADVTARKEAEHALGRVAGQLAETERRFRDIAENVRAVFWIRNAATAEVLYVSPAYEEIWGRPIDGLLRDGRTWLDAIHPDDRPRIVSEALEQESSDSYDAHYRIIRPDGSIRWIHDRAFTLRDSVERTEVVTGMAEDVTERRHTEAALAEARERARAAFLNAPMGSAIFAVAENGRGPLLEVNPAFCSMFGYPEAELVGRSPDVIAGPDDEGQRARWQSLLSGEVDTFSDERRLRRADGRSIWGRVQISLVRDAGGEPIYGVAQVQDITAAKRSEAQQLAVARLGQRALERVGLLHLMDEAVAAVRQTLGTTVAGILEHDAARGVLLGRVVDAASAELRPPRAEPLTGRTHIRVALDERRPVVIDDWSTETDLGLTELARAVGATSTISVPIQGPKGAWGVLSTHSREQRAFAPDEVSFVQAIANVLGAAIQRWVVEEETRHRALHDPLTELPNRTLFLDRLGHALDRASRGGGQTAVLFMDLDHFKVINDSLGHEAGDKLLQAFAPRLQETLRPSDTVARFGGDEFVVLCEDLQSEADAVHLAERILGSLEKPFQIDQHELFTSASIGLALARPDASPEGLISDADAAMYRAKADGRSRYGLFDRAMRRRVSERLRTENALRKALSDGALELHFQPIVALEDRAIVAAEALLRWHDADRGWISPADFIGIAEESGLIVPLGEWVLEEATRLALQWPMPVDGRHKPRLAVNLSARQVAHPAFCDRLAATLDRTGLPPEHLSLEITESILIDGADGPMNAMREIKRLGVRLALDDFGTGYSSLSYLNRLPIDVLKLDRSFIAPLREQGDRMAAIVSGMVTMAEALGMTVVAEGVEELSQAERLRSLGCDFAQGFLFARPVPPAELDELFRGGALPARPTGARAAGR